MSTQAINEALTILKKNNFKYTKKREAMLLYLIEQNKYVNAREVYVALHQQFSGISYDTVYRNLKDFSQLGLVEETELNGEMRFRYQCKHAESKHHHHFICTSCGATREIHMCPMDYFQDQLSGYSIESHRFEIFGKCPNCLEKNN